MAWYTAPSGVTCLAAYDAIGASSLADSYTNEANPGTYTAAPGVAPTWAQGTGWTFNGSTQYLTLGLSAATKPVSYVIRMTPADASSSLQAPLAASATGGLMFDFRNSGVVDIRFLKQSVVVIGSSTAQLVQATNVVVAITYSGVGAYAIYKNAGTPATGTNNQTPSASTLQVSGQASRFFHGDVAALAVYDGVLTADDVSAITTAMNALPTLSAPSMLQHHAAMLAGGR